MRDSHVSRTSSFTRSTTPKVRMAAWRGALIRRHPGANVLLGEHVEMEGQLGVELALVARTPEE